MSLIISQYRYQATIVRVIDGDTIEVDLDFGRHIWQRNVKHRLQGCNAAPLIHANQTNIPPINTTTTMTQLPSTPAQQAGVAAWVNLMQLLPAGAIFTLHSYKPYKYGDEYMCDIEIAPGQSLVDKLIAEQWAAPWNGQGTPPLPPWPRTV